VFVMRMRNPLLGAMLAGAALASLSSALQPAKPVVYSGRKVSRLRTVPVDPGEVRPPRPKQRTARGRKQRKVEAMREAQRFERGMRKNGFERIVLDVARHVAEEATEAALATFKADPRSWANKSEAEIMADIQAMQDALAASHFVPADRLGYAVPE
jgi:hypothetical protein